MGERKRMIYTDATRKAMKIMYQQHMGQTDKSGVPYCFHPWHVAESMTDELTACAALLHDVIEDTDMTIEELAEEGFPEPVLVALEILTRPEGVSYDDYIRRIAPNEIARKVKMSDLRHNMDETRLRRISPKDEARKEKYERSLRYLEEFERG